MRTAKYIISSAIGAILWTSAAHAALTNVDYIEIKNPTTYLQVGEVVATQAGTGTDVALASNGAIATATSVYDPVYSAASFAIDGLYPAGYLSPGYPGPSGIYHGASGSGGDILTVTLAAPASLASLTIYGRTDCCGSRDFYDISIFNSANHLIWSGSLDNTALNGLGNTVAFGTPEPSTWLMILAGFAAVVLLGARKAARKVALPI